MAEKASEVQAALAEGVVDLSRKPRFVEMDRDADRRYSRATVKVKVAAAKAFGKMFAKPSPYKEYFSEEMQTKEVISFWKRPATR